MTEARASLYVADKRWLDERCACGHERRRHLYAEGACVHAGRPYCSCRGYVAAGDTPLELDEHDHDELAALENARREGEADGDD